jgi:hypothetical protein
VACIEARERHIDGRQFVACTVVYLRQHIIVLALNRLLGEVGTEWLVLPAQVQINPPPTADKVAALD